MVISLFLTSLVTQAQQKKAAAKPIVEAEAPVKQTTISVIGPFKIGETKVTFMLTLQDSLNPGAKIPVTDLQIRPMEFEGTNIAEVVNNHFFLNKAHRESTTCPNSRVFYLDRLLIGDDEYTEIFLHFFNGKLFSLKCEAPIKLGEKLAAKFGQPMSTTTVKDRPYMGVRVFQHKEVNSYWHNQTIKARLYSSSGAEWGEHSYFIIRDEAVYKEWKICDDESLANRKKRIEKDRKAIEEGKLLQIPTY